MSFTTLRRSRPLVLADITILRFTFSRLIVFGPLDDSTSATSESGMRCPSAVSIIMSSMRSMVLRSSSSTRTTRLKLLPLSYTCETVSPAMHTDTNCANSGSVIPYLRSMSRRGTIFSSGRSICCSTFRSAMPSTGSMASFISLPIRNMRFRSSPNSFMAMFACVPLSIASMR